MIRRWLNRVIQWADGYNNHTPENCSPPDIEMPTPLRFKVQTAAGGTIVEIVHWDRNKCENRVHLHVIPDSESDMPQAIAKIVTIELLKV
jgi:hypothetical protein